MIFFTVGFDHFETEDINSHFTCNYCDKDVIRCDIQIDSTTSVEVVILKKKVQFSKFSPRKHPHILTLEIRFLETKGGGMYLVFPVIVIIIIICFVFNFMNLYKRIGIFGVKHYNLGT